MLCRQCRVRSRAVWNGFRTEIFVAAKVHVRNRARSRHNSWRLVVRSFFTTLRGPEYLLQSSVCVRFRAIRSGFRTEIFEKFLRPQIFAYEIARDRAQFHRAWWFAASSRPLEVPNICCERQAARRITGVLSGKDSGFQPWHS